MKDLHHNDYHDQEEMVGRDRSREGEDAEGFDPFRFARRCGGGGGGGGGGMGLLVGAAGAAVGWKFDGPWFRSEGLVRIAYTLPQVIRETDQNKPMAMFESFMRSQQLRMSSRGMIEAGLKRAHGGRAPTPWEIADVADHLIVEHLGATEQLHVTFVDHDAVAASLIVNSLINVFADGYEEQDKRKEEQRLATLEAHKAQLVEQVKAIEQRADRIVVADTVLRQYLNQEAILERQLESLRQGGYLEGHDQVVLMNAALRRVREQIRQCSQDVQNLPWPTDAVDPAADAGLSALREPSEKPLESRQSRQDSLRASQQPLQASRRVPSGAWASPDRGLIDPDPVAGDGQAQRDMVYLGAKRLELERLQGEGGQLRTALEETSNRIESLKLESTAGGRLDVISPGDIAVQPFRDRRKLYAAAGGVGGMLVPAAMLLLLGLARPRYRYSDETEDDLGENVSLLGILPELPDDLKDPARAAAAAQCVHQMRVMLHVGNQNKPGMYLLTSACPGEGKTSLALGLGLSFAAAGCRTLVVDADLVGRRLTHGFGAEGDTGFYEALSADSLAPFIRQCSNGLWIMPAGRVGPLHAGRIPAAAVKAVLAAAHREFDAVLVDSGPILGSVEASVVAPEVDGVIVAVARGQQPALLEKTIRHIRSVGGAPAGMVFNKARSRDFFRSSYGSAARPVSSHEMLVRMLSAESDGLLRFGPLVKAVMSSLPAADLEELESHHHHAAPLLG